MSILCVIPVRGGSKGVPRKNLRVVAGKPLVVWTIEQALAARADLDILVSTDDPEIAEVAKDAGADVPFLRPSTLARDETPTEPVVRHAIGVRVEQGRRPDAVMLLQATSPVRFAGTLDRAVEQFHATGVDSLVGVVPQTPFLWMMGAEPVAAYEPSRRPRRQDLAPEDYAYRETGSLYLTKTSLYSECGSRLGGRIGLFVMDEREGVDVDTELDLLIAEQHLDWFRCELDGGERAS
ncbi:acylneuraminate cytidylyltransferase family protein [Sinomonas sp.]|uniref:acylneuraminate cytidylyltransferase family protein n=1 Tax=Sinomonas sp. TaxID=1914986 RepID=UPI002B5AA763|nr:acylneuraminate cytidylyltransferase family protein [Sinomonas sp.]